MTNPVKLKHATPPFELVKVAKLQIFNKQFYKGIIIRRKSTMGD